MLEAMGMSMADSDEDLDDEDEDAFVLRLMREIQAKDSQLQMAAEIGQSLLEKNETLAEQVEALQDAAVQTDSSVEELQYR
eukprot:SAG22_NODE_19706_length_272_cov_0.878613_1_plen_80_part_10